MRPYRRLLGARGTTRALAALAAAAAVALAPDPVQAQTLDGFPVVKPTHVSAGGDPNTPDLDLSQAEARARSLFNMRAASDVAYTGMRMAGTMSYFVSNAGPGDYNYNPGYLGYHLRAGAWRHNFFEITMMAGVPRSTWVRYRDQIPSLQNIRNDDGYSAYMNGLLLSGMQNFSAADETLGEMFSGIASTSDGTCRDHTGARSGFLNSGVPLLAGSNCLETWGRNGWEGGRPITVDSWGELFAQQGDAFRFDWWNVPEEYQAGGFIGNFQTYGRISDYYRERLADFGAVIPGGSGAPVKDGYPLGLDIHFDAFSFTLPTVANAFIWRATITNNSANVYGGNGMDYDSLYIGFSPQPSNETQASATYYEPQNGTIRWVTNGTTPNCNNVVTGGVYGACASPAGAGFGWGASQMIVLNSPIGDLRNKLFTQPGPFFDPSHPAAGDTITFNHGHICGYGGCAANTILTGRDRRRFGLVSSTEVNVLDGRTPESLGDSEYWRTFHNAAFPARTGFNRYVPGDWSYSNRPPGAPVGPDTLFLDSCVGSGTPAEACVVTWSDSLPGGVNNRYGNVQLFGIGPFPLRAGETTKITIAVMVTPDSITTEEIQKSVIDLYQNFWLSPQSPATGRSVVQLPDGSTHVNEPHAIVATDVTPGALGETAVTLFLNDGAEEWVDPFLLDFYGKLESAPDGTALATLRQLNPWLADSILARASNNVEALHIYKSCNGGVSWTRTSDCRGNPAVDQNNNPVGNGWQPVATLRPDANGRFVNTFRDTGVRPGITYLYTISTESRGAKWNVLDLDAEGAVIAREFEAAPQLLAPIASATSEPNVARIYIPASIQAGGSRATVAVPADGQAGPARVPFNPFVVQLAGEPDAASTYRVVFGSAFEVIRTDNSTEVRVTRGDEEEVFSFARGDITTVNATGATSTVEEAGDTIRQTLTGALGIAVVRVSDGAPLLVSTQLEENQTTPGSFIAREDFPNFTLSVDNSRGGQIHGSFYTNPAGDSIRSQAEPNLNWDRNSTKLGAVSTTAVGEYVFHFQANPYGPNAPFQIVFGSPATTSEAVRASLNARATAQTGTVSAEDWELLRDAIVAEYSGSIDPRAAQAAAALTEADLEAVKLPFTVRNESFDRAVKAAMLKRTVRARLDALNDGLDPEAVELRVAAANRIALGSGVDVQTGVEIPEDTWVPGDRLYFIETIGETERLTWNRAVVHCVDPRPTCNPVRGRGSSAYIAPNADYRLRVRYYVPFTEQSEFRVAVTPAVAGGSVTVTQSDLDGILVAPNPYLVRSQFEQTSATEAGVYFVGMPPTGTLRIYTVAGQFVQEIRWAQDDLVSLDATLQARPRASGDLRYNLRTREGNELASGLYVFVVEAGGHKKIGKFVVIR